MAKKKEIRIEFGIKKISIMGFNVNSEKMALTESDLTRFDFNMEIGFGVVPAEKEVRFIFSFSVHPYQKKDIEVGKLTIEVIFFIVNMESIMQANKKKIKLPDMFLASLIGIVISTARGVWVSKVAGTSLDSAILPVLNPSEFLKKLKNNK